VSKQIVFPSLLLSTSANGAFVLAAGRYASTIARLAAEKTVAAVAWPEVYMHTGKPDSLEAAMRSRYVTLSQKQQSDASAAMVLQLLSGLPARRALLGAFFSIDLKSALDVEEQARRIPVPPMSVAADATPLPAAATPTFTKLMLRLHKVTCVDETSPGPWSGSESGTDKIDCGISSIDAVGHVHAIPRFHVGEFERDGVVKTYGQLKTLVTFDLSEGPSWPKTYTAVVILSEARMGNFPEFLNQLTERLQSSVTEYAVAAAGVPSGEPIGAVLSLLIKEAVALALVETLKFILGLWRDGFLPQQLAIRIPSASIKFLRPRSSPANHSLDRMATFTFAGGKYTVRYDWLLAT